MGDPKVDEDPSRLLVSALSKITGKAMPKKMTAEAKKNVVNDSIGWLRENDPGRLDMVDDATAKAFAELAGIPYEGRVLSADETKRKAMKDALEWVRNNDPKVDEDPSRLRVSALSKITGKAMPKKMTAEAKKKFVKDSIDWLRENDPGRLDTVDDETAKAFTELAGIPYEGRVLSDEEMKRKAMKDALEWVRNNDPEIDDDPSRLLVNALSKLTGK